MKIVWSAGSSLSMMVLTMQVKFLGDALSSSIVCLPLWLFQIRLRRLRSMGDTFSVM